MERWSGICWQMESLGVEMNMDNKWRGMERDELQSVNTSRNTPS